MGRLQAGEVSQSASQDYRSFGPKRVIRPKFYVGKAQSQAGWRRGLGRGGRQQQNCIDASRGRLKASGYKARGKKKMDYPELKKGDTVRYVDLKKLCAVGGQSSSRSFLVGVVSEFKVCNVVPGSLADPPKTALLSARWSWPTQGSQKLVGRARAQRYHSTSSEVTRHESN